MEKGGPHRSSTEEARARIMQEVRWMVDEASGNEQDCSKTGKCYLLVVLFSIFFLYYFDYFCLKCSNLCVFWLITNLPLGKK